MDKVGSCRHKAALVRLYVLYLFHNFGGNAASYVGVAVPANFDLGHRYLPSATARARARVVAPTSTSRSDIFEF